MNANIHNFLTENIFYGWKALRESRYYFLLSAIFFRFRETLRER